MPVRCACCERRCHCDDRDRNRREGRSACGHRGRESGSEPARPPRRTPVCRPGRPGHEGGTTWRRPARRPRPGLVPRACRRDGRARHRPEGRGWTRAAGIAARRRAAAPDRQQAVVPGAPGTLVGPHALCVPAPESGGHHRWCRRSRRTPRPRPHLPGRGGTAGAAAAAGITVRRSARRGTRDVRRACRALRRTRQRHRVLPRGCARGRGARARSPTAVRPDRRRCSPRWRVADLPRLPHQRRARRACRGRAAVRPPGRRAARSGRGVGRAPCGSFGCVLGAVGRAARPPTRRGAPAAPPGARATP